jgi:hypothetical protein
MSNAKSTLDLPTRTGLSIDLSDLGQARGPTERRITRRWYGRVVSRLPFTGQRTAARRTPPR